MSLTLVCMYIVVGLCFLLFVNYKFLKLFITSLNQKFTTDANRNNIKVSNKNSTFVSDKGQNIWSIPGPLKIPFLGTKWIYLWKYKMSKIHEVYRGEISGGVNKFIIRNMKYNLNKWTYFGIQILTKNMDKLYWK